MFGYSKKHERPVSPGARAHCCYLFIFTFPRTAAAAFPQAHSVSPDVSNRTRPLRNLKKTGM